MLPIIFGIRSIKKCLTILLLLYNTYAMREKVLFKEEKGNILDGTN